MPPAIPTLAQHKLGIFQNLLLGQPAQSLFHAKAKTSLGHTVLLQTAKDELSLVCSHSEVQQWHDLLRELAQELLLLQMLAICQRKRNILKQRKRLDELTAGTFEFYFSTAELLSFNPSRSQIMFNGSSLTLTEKVISFSAEPIASPPQTISPALTPKTETPPIIDSVLFP